MTRQRAIIISTADWDHPVQTNKQHVARTLASIGWEVLYVESLALRPLSARVAGDGARIKRRLRGAIRGVHWVQDGVAVVSPLVLPNWGRSWVRRLNTLVLAIQALVWRFSWGPSELIIVYAPVGELLLAPLGSKNRRGATKVVYHCVDDIAAQPNMPADLISAWEAKLVSKSVGVITTSPELSARARRLGARNILEQTNVVDFERFAEARSQREGRPVGKTIGFLGAISLYKFELDWVIFAAQSRPDFSFELYGPVGEGDAGTSLDDFVLPPNVHLNGRVEMNDVPAVMSTFDVAIVPSPVNRYTASMFPMKFFEYLAAGVPVVASDLPALKQFAHVAFLARDREEFLQSIVAALDGAGPTLNERLDVARRYTYLGRTKAMLAELERW